MPVIVCSKRYQKKINCSDSFNYQAKNIFYLKYFKLNRIHPTGRACGFSAHAIKIKDCLSNISVKGKHPSWKTAYVRQHNTIYNRQLKKLPCQNCGFDQHVELAHIKPVSSFSEEAKLVEVNAPENILVLCPNCHWMFDHNRLKLEEIPPRN
jgi:hypothetical protein